MINFSRDTTPAAPGASTNECRHNVRRKYYKCKFIRHFINGYRSPPLMLLFFCSSVVTTSSPRSRKTLRVVHATTSWLCSVAGAASAAGSLKRKTIISRWPSYFFLPLPSTVLYCWFLREVKRLTCLHISTRVLRHPSTRAANQATLVAVREA